MLAKHTLLVPEHPKKEWLAEVFRDRYLFEFIELKAPHSEFELKKALILKMKQFLLELGRDFMFLDYWIEMCVNHMRIHLLAWCFVNLKPRDCR